MFFFIVCVNVSCSFIDTERNVVLPTNLMDGDLILRCGRGVVSQAVLTGDKLGLYSHIGILINDTDGPKVIHQVPSENNASDSLDQIKVESLKSFLAPSKAKSGAILRMNLEHDKMILVVAKAKQILEQKLLFDHDYNLADSTKMYCTEFIWHIFLAANYDITNGKRTTINFPPFSGEYIFPSDISQNDSLKTVYSYKL